MGGGEYYASQANYNEAINLDPTKYKQWTTLQTGFIPMT